MSRKLQESSIVTSLVLEPADGEPLTAALAGQFIVLRLRPGPDESTLLRSYSLSGAPSKDRYRISVKREPQAAAGAYIYTRVEAGDILDVSAPRGSFTLLQGERPVVLVSAGIGATPVLAMLHALAAEQTRREIWWIYGACRTGVCHNCETGLISGSVLHRPDPVEPPAAGNLLICCSPPPGRYRH